MNEIGRDLSRGHHPLEVKVHTPRSRVNSIIYPATRLPGVPFYAWRLPADHGGPGGVVLIVSLPHILLFRGKNSLPPTAAPQRPPPSRTPARLRPCLNDRLAGPPSAPPSLERLTAPLRPLYLGPSAQELHFGTLSPSFWWISSA